MGRVVDIGQAGEEIERAVMAMLDEGTIALKVEGSIEVGDKLAHTQRFLTGQLANSTSVSGQRLVKKDPGAGFYLPASRIELTQEAEARISRDAPGSDAHVSEGAGVREDKEYGGYVEARYGLAQRAIDVTSSNRAVVTRAEKRALRKLRGRI